MCTLDVNSLIQFNVHGIDEKDFTLHEPSIFTSCQELGPLSFCLLPPSSRLAVMCPQPLKVLFDAMIDGTVNSISQMPVVWNSLEEKEEDDNTPWIRDALITDPNITYPNIDNGLYLGLQKLPNFNEVALTNNFAFMWGVAEGRLFRTGQTGFMEAEARVTNGANNDFQNVVLNSSGSFGAVLFSNKLVLWRGDTDFFLDVIVPPGTNLMYSNMKLYELNGITSIVVVSKNIVLNTTCVISKYDNSVNPDQMDFAFSHLITGLPSNFFVKWSALTDDFQHMLVSIDSDISNPNRIYIVNVATSAAPPSLQWTVSRGIQIIDPSAKTYAICRGVIGANTSLFVYSCLKQLQFLFATNLQTSQVLAQESLTDLGTTNRIVEDLQHTYYAFITTTSIKELYVGTGDGPPAISPTLGIDIAEDDAVMGFFADGSRTLSISTQSDLRFNVNASGFGLVWTTNFKLFRSENAHVSDFGLLENNPLTPNPSITWFFGYRNYPKVKAGDILVSPHQYYRLVIDSQIVIDSDSYPHIANVYLERANVVGLINAAGSASLFEDSNLQVTYEEEDAHEVEVVWMRSTHDAFSSRVVSKDIDANALLESRNPLGSSNGLYLLYRPQSEEGGGIRVIVNVFNSAVFAEYCALSPERLSRAIERQKDFCFDYLFVNNNGVLFADNRCTCIGGSRLTELLFPNRTFNAVTRKRLDENLPCLLKTCQESIDVYEISNVSLTVFKRCQNAPLTVCSSVIATDGQGSSNLFETTTGVVIQKCGANLLECRQDNECPIGTTCVNGNCTPNCIFNADCITGATCQQGICIAPSALNPNINNSTKSSAFYVMITLIVLVGLLFLALLLVLLLTRNT